MNVAQSSVSIASCLAICDGSREKAARNPGSRNSLPKAVERSIAMAKTAQFRQLRSQLVRCWKILIPFENDRLYRSVTDNLPGEREQIWLDGFSMAIGETFSIMRIADEMKLDDAVGIYRPHPGDWVEVDDCGN